MEVVIMECKHSIAGRSGARSFVYSLKLVVEKKRMILFSVVVKYVLW